MSTKLLQLLGQAVTASSIVLHELDTFCAPAGVHCLFLRKIQHHVRERPSMDKGWKYSYCRRHAHLGEVVKTECNTSSYRNRVMMMKGEQQQKKATVLTRRGVRHVIIISADKAEAFEAGQHAGLPSCRSVDMQCEGLDSLIVSFLRQKPSKRLKTLHPSTGQSNTLHSFRVALLIQRPSITTCLLQGFLTSSSSM